MYLKQLIIKYIEINSILHDTGIKLMIKKTVNSDKIDHEIST